jgi:hypothetical protein
MACRQKKPVMKDIFVSKMHDGDGYDDAWTTTQCWASLVLLGWGGDIYLDVRMAALRERRVSASHRWMDLVWQGLASADEGPGLVLDTVLYSVIYIFYSNL